MTSAAARRATRGRNNEQAGRLGVIGDASVMDAGAVSAALDVDVETGLSAQEAARRLAQNAGRYWLTQRVLPFTS